MTRIPNTALKTAIFESPLTQCDVAERSGLHESRLSRIIHRRGAEPREDEKRAIAKALRRPVHELFPDTHEKAVSA